MPFSSGFHFHFSSLRINIKGYSGTAGKISSLGTPGSDFSTKDADNDKCVCKCSQLTTGGKRTAPQQHASTYLNISHVSCSLKIQVLRTMSKNEYITIWITSMLELLDTSTDKIPTPKVEVTRAQLAQNPISDKYSGDLRIHDSWQ